MRTSYQRPAAKCWLQRGATWDGEASGRLHPTLVRHLWRTAPPAIATNIESCDIETISRWEQDWWSFSPYLYLAANLFTDARGHLRLAGVAERARMMHFPVNYLLAATPSALSAPKVAA